MRDDNFSKNIMLPYLNYLIYRGNQRNKNPKTSDYLKEFSCQKDWNMGEVI